jgi:3-phosphoshikimate 1-carboxyvinyltransferase
VPATSTGQVVIEPARRVRGRLRVPGDKSISHRYAIIAALARGRSRIEGYAPGADCATTLATIEQLGVTVRRTAGQTIEIDGRGLRGLTRSERTIDAGNSGTTLRLMAGVTAAHPFDTEFTGDDSLRRRPMRRVIAPLERMGARIESNEGRAPLRIHGARLHGIHYQPDTPSAQVKSLVLLAGLQADGATSYAEPTPTRDHTERALVAFGVAVEREGDRISVTGGNQPEGRTVHVPGDVSSAAFFAVAAASLDGSDVEVVDLGLNPSRTAILDRLSDFGARVEVAVQHEADGEPWGSVRVRPGRLGKLTLSAGDVPALIDELPVLAALATHGGEIHVTGAGELRVKESDRISALVAGLRAFGADAEELPDGFHVTGGRRLPGGSADAAGDHRLAMAFAIAALGADRPCSITGAEAVAISYPGFFDVLKSLCA